MYSPRAQADRQLYRKHMFEELSNNTPNLDLLSGAVEVTYIHTYIHTYMHTYIHTYIHTYTYMHAGS